VGRFGELQNVKLDHQRLTNERQRRPLGIIEHSVIILGMGIVTFPHDSQAGGYGALADGENRPGQQDLRVFQTDVVAGANRFGEQFRSGRNLPVEIDPEQPMVINAFAVLFITLKRETDIFSTYGWCGQFCQCLFLHHKQYAAFASHHPFISSKSDHKIR